MQDQESRRGDAGKRHPHRPERQSDMEKTSPFASLEADILARIGLQQQSAALPDDPTVSVPNWRKHIFAVQQLVKEGEQAHVERITSQYLYDPDERVRMEAIRGLARIAQDRFRPGLVPPERFAGALGDDSPQVRATAVQALTLLGASWLTDDLIAFLIKKLDGEKKPERWQKKEQKPEREDELVRIAMMQLFVKLHEIRAVPAIVDQLDDKDWQIREMAVLSLASFLTELSPQQLEKLRSMLYDENYFVREAAKLTLKGQWPLENLLRDLRSHSSDKQAGAARILGELGQPTNAIVDVLHKVAIDRSVGTRARVAALHSLKDLRIDIPKTELGRLFQDQSEEVRAAAHVLDEALNSKPIDPASETRDPMKYDLDSPDSRER